MPKPLLAGWLDSLTFPYFCLFYAGISSSDCGNFSLKQLLPLNIYYHYSSCWCLPLKRAAAAAAAAWFWSLSLSIVRSWAIFLAKQKMQLTLLSLVKDCMTSSNSLDWFPKEMFYLIGLILHFDPAHLLMLQCKIKAQSGSLMSVSGQQHQVKSVLKIINFWPYIESDV